MKPTNDSGTSRREFLRDTGRLAAASALAGVALPQVHAASSDEIRLALIGCGGRGTGAVQNALNTQNQGPIKLVAMADVFEDRLNSSYGTLRRAKRDHVQVPRDRRFIGFDAYQKAMDCLRPGDVAIFTTPLAFRWVHFGYAIAKGLNVFMEKPLSADGVTTRRLIQQAGEATRKNLKVGVGLMSRHSRHLQELAKRVQDGAIGDIILSRGYRVHGPVGSFASLPKPANISHLHYQIRRFHSFIWASGGCYNDFYIHIVDHLCWMKNAWPVKVQALGGRHYKTSPEGIEYVDQNFDVYAVEYTFADGTKFNLEGRCMTGCENIYASYLHGTKGMAVASKHGDCGAPSSLYKSQNIRRADQFWQSSAPRGQENPYDNEWQDLVEAIRNDRPYNEVKRGAEASMVSSMGRKAAHTGQAITFDEMLNSDQEYAPGVDKLTDDSDAPLMPGPDGRYPQPAPGIKKDREW